MARCDTTEKILASPSRVWAWFQPDRLGQWYGHPIQALSPGPLGKSARLRVAGYEATVTEYAENRMLNWEGDDDGTSHRVAFLLTPRDGGTLILLRTEFHRPGLLGRLSERFQVGTVATRDQTSLAKLKRLAEQN